MSKQTQYLISNAREAEEIILYIMQKQDTIRAQRNQAAVKCANATRQAQYDHYFCRVTILDNELIKLYRATDQIAEFLPMPK